VNFKGIKI